MSIELYFENTLKMFFGGKAKQTASEATTPKYRKKWLLKTVNQITKDVDGLDTSLKHKQLLLSLLQNLTENIREGDEPSWKMVYILLRVCGQLMGWKIIIGSRVCNLSVPIYCRDQSQYITEKTLKGEDTLKIFDKDIVSIRACIIKQLKNEGVDTFHIGLILNISEYKVKQYTKLL